MKRSRPGVSQRRGWFNHDLGWSFDLIAGGAV
jgi:hypothetical protein